MTDAIALRIAPKEKDLGGFTVRRILPHARQRLVGPFIFYDQMGPARFAPGQAVDVRPHPHIGLATVTYLFEGALGHLDNVGGEVVIRPGDVNWMTAGRGVVHSERTPSPEREDGHPLYGIQVWVALPESDEDADPEFHHHPAADLPSFERGGAQMRLILGNAWDHHSPVSVLSPIFYVHCEAPTGSKFSMDVGHEERAVHVVHGRALVAGEEIGAGEMAILTPGADVEIEAVEDTRLMLAGGAPLGSRKIWWNFVASSPERLEAAKADWGAAAEAGFPEGGRFTLPPGESEHIPLPGK